MITSFVFATLLSRPLVAETFEAAGDVWVYSHASDPGSDSALRIFGNGGNAVAKTSGDLESFSYGYLKFDLTSIPSNPKIVSAELVLTPVGKPAIDPNSKNWPLEARPLVGSFEEKTWTFDLAQDITPSKDQVFGSGVIKTTSVDEQYEIRINLLGEKSTFKDLVSRGSESKLPIFMALTSKYDASELGMKGMYKVHSKDNKDQAVRPRIEIKLSGAAQ